MSIAERGSRATASTLPRESHKICRTPTFVMGCARGGVWMLIGRPPIALEQGRLGQWLAVRLSEPMAEPHFHTKHAVQIALTNQRNAIAQVVLDLDHSLL